MCGLHHFLGQMSDWVITPDVKAKYDTYFDGIDKDHVGLVTGDQARGLFMASNLPQQTLAFIWLVVEGRGWADIEGCAHHCWYHIADKFSSYNFSYFRGRRPTTKLNNTKMFCRCFIEIIFLKFSALSIIAKNLLSAKTSRSTVFLLLYWYFSCLSHP